MKPYLSVLPLMLVLAACSSTKPVQKFDEPFYFSDTAGKTNTANFTQAPSNGQVAGKFTVNGKTALDIVKISDDVSIAVSDNKNRSRADKLKLLAAAKYFTVYSFNKQTGALEVDKISGSKNICTAYRKNGVKVEIAENMYLGKGSSTVLRSKGILAATAAKNKIIESELDFSYAQDVSKRKKMKAEKQKDDKVTAHYERLNSFIAKDICGK
ncbi:hypothetical protein [Neisseria chenwenguii]|uniref:DUF8095 domain-containing protein n=1 Tax=Neisseria chenwenguii TaxID=1853278 RepID=A0A220S0B7_9NEIS|nr:hypothetical protein [Neisseria chenwenguii]ASK26806.1 hypothetical protein BG910_02780 [Neisseria chenwenguii]ROV56783.1 hypothetical protein EGS38_02795 [Neisseria chenwenguii]